MSRAAHPFIACRLAVTRPLYGVSRFRDPGISYLPLAIVYSVVIKLSTSNPQPRIKEPPPHRDSLDSLDSFDFSPVRCDIISHHAPNSLDASTSLGACSPTPPGPFRDRPGTVAASIAYPSVCAHGAEPSADTGGAVTKIARPHPSRRARSLPSRRWNEAVESRGGRTTLSRGIRAEEEINRWCPVR